MILTKEGVYACPQCESGIVAFDDAYIYYGWYCDRCDYANYSGDAKTSVKEEETNE